MKIDLNCDLGESFGRYVLGDDAGIMPHISSVNIACGAHAGDPTIMRKTVRLALEHHVAIGAHPGYPDLQGFGRRKMNFDPQEVEDFILYQLGALSAFIQAEGGNLIHVKPHGALYNQASVDRAMAEAICRGVALFSQDLILVGLAGSALLEMGRKHSLPVAAEGFPDRGYQPDGNLTPRGLPGSLVTDPETIAENAARLCRDGIKIIAGQTEEVLRIDTLCLHGDHPHAAETAARVRERLEEKHIKIQSLEKA
ncbi:MAG: 5-oxoprolinase subunit PxpA [Anaerolineae bacterium]|nr:5-oxoprolinase subunit PxpA [Anaerolineae bacterium]